MTEEEKSLQQQNIQKTNATLKAEENTEAPVEKKKMQPEYGYKPKGPEPTRYGDW